MEIGNVDWFDRFKGYGYITHKDGRVLYFHQASLSDPVNASAISSGMIVFFDIFETQLGWEATNVKMLLDATG
jgi:cold shock CspA family protein